MQASEKNGIERKNLPGIFISYRRTDTPDAVGRIYDRLIAEFGKSRVFKDVDSIPLGQDFRGHLNEIIAGCATVLAIIGPKWIDARDKAGQRRLEDPDDFVRIELEAAMTRAIPVVPVLVGHAPIPVAAELPASMASMAYRQSIEVRPDPDFHNDVTRLMAALRAMLDPDAPVVEPNPAAARRPRSLLNWMTGLAAVAFVAALALAVPALKYLRAPLPAETRLEISTPATDMPMDFALAPDGQQIVFVANDGGTSRLWLRPLAATLARPLPGTDGATAPFWSPDGRSISFIAARSLKRVDLGGGQPQTLGSMGNGAVGTWGAEDTILLVRGPANSIERISASGGEPTDATGMPPESAPHRWPQFLPDGRRFLFLASPATGVTGDARSGTYLGALDGKPPVRLSANTSRFVYLPSGWLLWLRSGALVAQRLDLDKAALSGPIVTVADNVAAMSVSNTGLIAYRQGESSKLQLKWVDRTGRVLGSAGEPDETNYSPRVAPDGHRIALARISQGNRDIWLLDGDRASRLSYKPLDDEFPVWSPDGTRIVYTSQQASNGDLYQRLAGAAGEGALLQSGGQIKFASSWSADGRFLLYFTPSVISTAARNNQNILNIWVRPMTGDQKPYPFHPAPFSEVWGQFSPDGKWVAYQSDESGKDEIYVKAFVSPAGAAADPRANGSAQVSTAGGMQPMWRADGKEIFYINPAGAMMAAPVAVQGTRLVPGTPAVLFQTHILGGGTDNATGRQYDLAPDGRFLINSRLDSGVTSAITLIQNWNPDAGK